MSKCCEANQRVAPTPPTGPRTSKVEAAWALTHTSCAGVKINILRVYNWTVWTLLAVILFAQFFGVIWSFVRTNTHFQFGQNPLMGKFTIPGFNDEPYSDRAVVCVKRGQYYIPKQLSQLLREQESIQRPPKYTTNGIDGYRVVSRDSFTMDATKFSHYKRQCNAITLTLEGIFATCTVLGYNVTRDVLRIADGVHTDDVTVVPSALPVLIIPYWDYGALSRYVVPGRDGSACVLRGSGMFEVDGSSSALMTGPPRIKREARTEEWLGYPGGVWRNGWYEDPVVHMRWYSDLTSSIPNGKFDIHAHQFNLMDNAREFDCSQPPYGCGGGDSTWSWNDQLNMRVELPWIESVAVSNGSRYGLFLFDALHSQTITSQYQLDKLISNASFVSLLSQWMLAMLALASSDTIGIGAVANSRSFRLLPVFLLPRLKTALESFWSSGCEFEGDQRALADAWFEVYPAIGEIVMIFFSLLNTVAKLLRRRVPDTLFGPTLLFFVLLHYFRAEIAASNWLEFDKRISTVVTSDQVAAAAIHDFFITDLAFRINGKITSLYTMKLSVFGINLIALILSRRACDDCHAENHLDIEVALAMRFTANAGLGSTNHSYGGRDRLRLRPYELVRGGYVAIGPFNGPEAKRSSLMALLSMADWFWLIVTVPIRRGSELVLRVVIYDLKLQAPGLLVPSKKPRLVSVTDERLATSSPWQVTAPYIH